MPFQRASARHPNDRKDHVWCRVEGKWICGLCGAMTRDMPPEYPTDNHWMPERYVKLTDEVKQQCGP